MNRDYLHIMSEEWQNRAQLDSAEFKTANPYPHGFFSSMFSKSFIEQLVAQFPPFEYGDVRNEMGGVGKKSSYTDFKALGGAYGDLDKTISSDYFLKDLSRITGIDDLLYDPHYYGGGTHENMNSQNMATHVDYNYHPITKLHRRINIIIYLNDKWSDDWGGMLQLHKNPWDPKEDYFKTVPCLSNNAIIFETSERSWHGFSEVRTPRHLNISRKSVALYFYTKDRPIEEIADSHGTVYVEPYLKSEVRSRDNLRLSDFYYVKSLVSRHSSYIEYLANRDSHFTKDIEEKLLRDTALQRSSPSNILSILDDFLSAQKKIMFGYYEKEKAISLLQSKLAHLQNDKKPPAFNELFWGAGVEVTNIAGLYEDRWMGEVLQFDLSRGSHDVDNLIIHFITQDQDQVELPCVVYVNEDEFHNVSWTSTRAGRTSLQLMGINALFPLKVRVCFKNTWIPVALGKGSDERVLSYLLDGIDCV